jgi:hypothetical protein
MSYPLVGLCVVRIPEHAGFNWHAGLPGCLSNSYPTCVLGIGFRKMWGQEVLLPMNNMTRDVPSKAV